jgi:hypothetical protein
LATVTPARPVGPTTRVWPATCTSGADYAKLARMCAWHSEFVNEGALRRLLKDAAAALEQVASDQFDREVRSLQQVVGSY